MPVDVDPNTMKDGLIEIDSLPSEKDHRTHAY